MMVKHRKIIVIVAILVMLLIFSVVYFWGLPPKEEESEQAKQDVVIDGEAEAEVTRVVTLLDGHSTTHYNNDGYIGAVHPSSTTSVSGYGQAFKVKTVGAKYKLTQCVFGIRKISGAYGHLKAVLYDVTGTYGTDAKPTGSALAESELVNIDDLTLAYQQVAFNFTGANQYEVLKDHVYGVDVQMVDGGGVGFWWLQFKENYGDNTHDGNQFTYHDLAWYYLTSYDCCFRVYGELVPPPPPPPTKKLTMNSPVGNGSVVPSVGEHTYDYGTKVTMTATPDDGNELKYWLIGISKYSVNPYDLYMYQDWTVTAYFGAIPSGGGWVSPTGFEDPDSKWTNEGNAYDDETSTYAEHDQLGLGAWGSYLILTHDAVVSDKVRFMAYYSGVDISTIDLDVFKDDVWVDVYEGTYGNAVWVEKTFDEGSVTKMRMRFKNKDIQYGIPKVYECDFWVISQTPVVAVGLGGGLGVLVTGKDKGRVVTLV